MIYAYDPRDSSKQAVALSTLDVLARTGRGRLSTQVLGYATTVSHNWDAQLWATVRLNQLPIVLSEDTDLADRVIDGVQFVNPFSPTFTFARLG